MIFAWITAKLLGMGIGENVAKKAAPYVFSFGVCLLLIGLALLWLHFHDRSVIETDRLQSRADVAETTVKAERDANAKDAERQTANQAKDAELRKAISDADTDEINPVGPVSRAVTDRLRERSNRTGAATD